MINKECYIRIAIILMFTSIDKQRHRSKSSKSVIITVVTKVTIELFYLWLHCISLGTNFIHFVVKGTQTRYNAHIILVIILLLVNKLSIDFKRLQCLLEKIFIYWLKYLYTLYINQQKSCCYVSEWISKLTKKNFYCCIFLSIFTYK